MTASYQSGNPGLFCNLYTHFEQLSYPDLLEKAIVCCTTCKDLGITTTWGVYMMALGLIIGFEVKESDWSS